MPDPLRAAARPSPSAPAADPAASLQREWLLTDGLGGYACGTAADVPTRRYHAWLCATIPGRGERVRFLAAVDERLDTARGEVALLAAHWRALPNPSLPALASTFHAHPLPTWVWSEGGGAHGAVAHGGVAFERSLAMAPGGRAVLVRWRNLGTEPLRLRARPLLALEPHDHLRRERSLDARVRHLHHAAAFQPDPSLPPLWLSHAGDGVFVDDACWYRDFHYAVDAARGYDADADRWSPGVFTAELAPGASVVVAFALAAPVGEPAAMFGQALAQRLRRAQWANQTESPLGARLRHGVDDFFRRDANGRLTVLAGFPWFGEWGRDTFLALPGLTLATGEPERCREVLRAALPFLRDGLLPNVYGNGPADSDYGAADAALWFTLAVQRWQASGVDAEQVRTEFGAALQSIAESCLAGTALGLRVDQDLVLCAGDSKLNATWMDARLPSGPVTPRHGQPVELAALWVSLLLHLAELQGGEWKARADRAGAAFVRRFVRTDGQGLYDRVADGVPDPAVRPNMVLAASLPRSPLSREQRQAVVDTAARELLTPVGLRTLSPHHPAYRGRYEGAVDARDRAYHQGTAWPWLLGAFVEASLRAAAPARRTEVAAALRQRLEAMLPEVDRAGIDHVSEVYDGDAPQRPNGTFAQAWNTGELLRALQLCAAPPVESRP